MNSYSIKSKLGAMLMRIFSVVAPSLSEKYQYFDTRMLKADEMSPNFPWEKYEKKKKTILRNGDLMCRN